ncbi:hypothetical protein [Nitrosopumilus sp. S4]
MQTVQILALFAIIFVGTITPAFAYDGEKWDDKRQILEEEFNQKRISIEKMFQEEYEALDRYYEDRKMEIYDKIESNSTLSDSEIDEMFNELFDEFDEKRQNLDSEMRIQFDELEKMFQEEMERISEEYDGTDNIYLEQKPDYKRHDYQESADYHTEYQEPYKDDPEWDSIEKLADKILDSIPMEKIQRLWESGDIESLIRLIVSETDLTEEEAKKVIMFFEKYDNKDYENHSIEPTRTDVVHDNNQVQKLEQRISELEEENRELRNHIADLEQKIKDINIILMEQVKFIYEWAMSQ